MWDDLFFLFLSDVWVFWAIAQHAFPALYLLSGDRAFSFVDLPLASHLWSILSWSSTLLYTSSQILFWLCNFVTMFKTPQTSLHSEFSRKLRLLFNYFVIWNLSSVSELACQLLFIDLACLNKITPSYTICFHQKQGQCASAPSSNVCMLPGGGGGWFIPKKKSLIPAGCLTTELNSDSLFFLPNGMPQDQDSYHWLSPSHS